MLYLVVFALTFSSTALLTPVVRHLAIVLGALDRPGYRRVHIRPTPRMGGVAMIASMFLAIVLSRGLTSATMGVLLGSVVLLILGVMDDIKGVPPKVKLIGQVLAAAIPVAYGFFFTWVVNPFGGAFFVDGLGAVFAVLWIVGLINTINLTDGLDGLAAGVTVIAAAAFFVLALVFRQPGVAIMSIALVGTALGFLQFNFSPAIIFMGDTGSMFLGYILALLALESMANRVSTTEFLIPLMIMGLPILDILFAIIRRRLNGRPIMSADRGHIHHRLLDYGLTTKQAVLFIYTLSTALGMLAIAIAYLKWYSLLVVLAMVLVIVVGYKFIHQKPAWLRRKYELKRGE